MADEIDDIARQAKLANNLREGVPGAQAGADDLRVRLNGGDPEVGRALRTQQPPDYSTIQQRLSTGPQPASPTATGDALRAQTTQPPRVSLQGTRFNTDVTLGSGGQQPPSTIRAVASRNVPIGAAGAGSAPVAGEPTTLTGSRFTTPVSSVAPQNPSFAKGAVSPEAAAFNASRAAPAATAAAPAAAPAVEAPSTVAQAARTAAPVAEAAPAYTSRLGALGSAVKNAAGYAGRLSVALPLAQEVGRHEINDQPGVDSSITGTGAALGRDIYSAVHEGNYQFPETNASLTKGGKEALADIAAAGLRVTDALGITNNAHDRFNEGLGKQGFTVHPDLLRNQLGLPPKPGAATTQTAAPAPVQQPSNVRSTTAPAAAPTTIMGAARTAVAPAPAAAEPQYELGKNAVEIYRPGGERTVATFAGPDGQGGAQGEVPGTIFDAGRTAAYRSAVAEGAIQRQTDPQQRIAAERAKGESDIAKERITQEGASARQRIQANAPHVVAPQRNPAAGLQGQPSVIDGAIVYPDTGQIKPLGVGKPSRNQLMSQVTAALRDKKTDPTTAAALWANETNEQGKFVLSADKKSWVFQPVQAVNQ